MLAKVAEVVKSVANPNGSRSSRNFVFTTVSPDQKQKPLAPKPPPVLQLFAIPFVFVKICLSIDTVGYPWTRTSCLWKSLLCGHLGENWQTQVMLKQDPNAVNSRSVLSPVQMQNREIDITQAEPAEEPPPSIQWFVRNLACKISVLLIPQIFFLGTNGVANQLEKMAVETDGDGGLFIKQSMTVVILSWVITFVWYYCHL